MQNIDNEINEIWNKWHKFYIESMTPSRKGIHKIHYEIFCEIAEPILQKLIRKSKRKIALKRKN